MAPKYTASIMACARWETQYITEWLLYHQSIGFDHVYLYCNDDDPADLYGEVLPFCRGEKPFVTFRHFPYQGQQFYMMMHGLRHHKDETEWVAFLDIDEFLVLPGLDSIKAYLQRCPPHWDAIHFNWSFFGNNGHVERPAGSVLRTYTRREDRLHESMKSMTRSAKIDFSVITRKIYVWHGWDGVFGAEFTAVNVLGDPIDRVLGDDQGATYVKPPETQARIRNAAFINHYAFKSVRDFELRVERGIMGDFHGQLGWKNLADSGGATAKLAELNATEDRYLADYWNRLLRPGQQGRVIPLPSLPNVALGKRADQSSVGEWSIHPATTAADAAGAINGVITGRAQFHTSLENQPWWSIELGAPHLIYEARVFNRVDQPAMRERLGAFRVDIRDGNGQSTTVYTHDGIRMIGGADGEPLILRFAPPITISGLRIVALGYTYLHLDQVELYGVECGEAPGAAAIIDHPSSTRRGGELDGPVVHVNHRGLLGNRMIEFLSAYAVASAVPGCRLSGVHLPEWGIDYPDLSATPGAREIRVAAPTMRLGRADLVRALSKGRIDRVVVDTYALHIDNLLPRKVCAGLFRPPSNDVPRAGPHELLIHIRCDNVLHPVDLDYVLIPFEFYEEIVASTGLHPVFMGQIGDNSYCCELRARFPNATFLPRRNETDDIDTLRRACNIVTSVSTFAWIGAWLSDAKQIHFLVNGVLNPAQYPTINLLPLDDPRYRFYLFPANFAVREQDWPAVHATMRGLWRLMDPAMLAEEQAGQPRFGEPPLDAIRPCFDETFYLDSDEAVRTAINTGGFKDGFDHYVRYGRSERRLPFPFDLAWYGRQYPIAAIEVAQGDFADFFHHYAAIGRRRGYRPLPPE
jgi:hypothetical protein